MLVLNRKPKEGIVFYTTDGEITVTVVESSSSKVRVGISAPNKVRVLRDELVYAIKREGGDPSKRVLKEAN